MTPRLTTDFWVRAYLARLRLADVPAYVIARGEGNAGAVLVKLATLDGQAQLFARQYDLATDRRRWVQTACGTEAEVDATIARDRARDPDLWVVEVESRHGVHLLDQDGLDG